MKIHVKYDALCGKQPIPAGEYLVSLSSESSEIVLAGRGKTYKVAATKRRMNARTRITTVQFYSGGGKQWSLIVSTPKHGEWITILEYQS